MNSFIKKVVLKKLWDYKDIVCNLNEDINILIGPNGSSKTTFIMIIEAILKVDLYSIENIKFDSIRIEIEKQRSIHNIEVKCALSDGIVPVFTYKLDNTEEISINMNEHRYLHFKKDPSSNVFVEYLRQRINQWINVSWLPITRVNSKIELDPEDTDVDRKLRILMRRVVSFKLQLETMINDRTKKYNEDIVSLLLYNKEYDSFPNNTEIQQIMDTSKNELRTSLHQVFSYFGDARAHSDAIEKHIEGIETMKSVLNKNGLSAEQLLSFAFLKRTLKMLSLTSDFQKDRVTINEPIRNYIELVGSFMKDKSLEFDEKGNPIVYLKKSGTSNKKEIKLTSLSSGEKQLLILLTETLLQQKNPHVYIADEPELSLHIEWQRKLVASIMSLNPMAQILFATHAPEIAANHSNKIINLQKCTRYEYAD